MSAAHVRAATAGLAQRRLHGRRRRGTRRATSSCGAAARRASSSGARAGTSGPCRRARLRRARGEAAPARRRTASAPPRRRRRPPAGRATLTRTLRSTRLVLAPPKANALTSAVRTGRAQRAPAHVAAVRSAGVGLAQARRRQHARRRRRPRSAHRKPSAPAPAIAWPSAPLTELRAPRSSAAPSTRRIAAASTASLSGVDVPCACT